MLGGLPSTSNLPPLCPKEDSQACSDLLSQLTYLPATEVLPTPLPFLVALPGSCSGVGGHRGQETACLAGARQTRQGLRIPSSLPDPSPVCLIQLLQVTLLPPLPFSAFTDSLF